MNKKIWREDRKIMLLTNSTGARILSSMDGERMLSKIVEEAYSDELKQFAGTNKGDSDFFNNAADFEDRFVQAAAYIISLWTRGFIVFATSDKAIKSGMCPDSVVSLHSQKRLVSIYNLLDELYKDSNESSSDMINILYKEKSDLLSLMNKDLIIPMFTGIIEECDEKRIDESNYPEYMTGYIRPALIDELKTIRDYCCDSSCKLNRLFVRNAGRYFPAAKKRGRATM